MAALRKLDASPMPSSNLQGQILAALGHVRALSMLAGSCMEGLWAVIFSGYSSKESRLDAPIMLMTHAC